MLQTPTEFSGARPKTLAGRAARYVCALDLDLLHACSKLLEDVDKRSLPTHALQVLKRCAAACASGDGAPDAGAPPSVDALCDTLRELLLIPSCAQHVAVHFHPILLHLLAAFLPSNGQDRLSWSAGKARAIFVMFGILLGPFEEIYPIFLEYVSHADLRDGPISETSEDAYELRASLVAYQRILQASPSFREDLPQPWPMGPLEAIYKSATAQEATLAESSSTQTRFCTATRLLALYVYTTALRLPEMARVEAERAFIGEASVLSDVGFPEGEARISEESAFGVDARMKLELEDGKDQVLDVWVLHAKEAMRWQSVWSRCQQAPVRYLPRDHSASAMQIDGQDALALNAQQLHPRVVAVGGVLLLRDRVPSDAPPPKFVETDSSFLTLTDLAIDISCRLPILLSGPPSSGKTSVLHYVYELLHPSARGRGLLTIPLGDSTGIDAKSLIGSYTSFPTSPGTFVWQEGSLTRAVRKGYWVILEDLDRASSEVLSIIKELARGMSPSKPAGHRPRLSLGNRGEVKAAPGFMLFGTRSAELRRRARFASDQSSPDGQQLAPATFFSHKHWAEVVLLPPTAAEIRHIVQRLFPLLQQASTTLVERIVGSWASLADAVASRTTKGRSGAMVGSLNRQASLRDLIKWCLRIETIVQLTQPMRDPLSNPIEQEHVLLDGLDIFLGAFPAHDPLSMTDIGGNPAYQELRKELAGVLARGLDIGSERVDWVLSQRAPEMSLRKDGASAAASSVSIGRVALPRSQSGDRMQNGERTTLRNFALTRASVTLMEQVAAALAMNEPILLVGETGTGKTTVVQQLASLASRPFTALNLSQQSEASDLLGGFKPIEPKMPAMDLHNEWYKLFTQSFSAKRNAKFIDAERKALQQGKWGRLSLLWKESGTMISERLAGGTIDDDSRKRRKTGTSSESRAGSPYDDGSFAPWAAFLARVDAFRLQHVQKTTSKRRFHFGFSEGPLVRAIRNGEWILLDEINLAADETLDFLSALLQSPTSSITLTERGDLEAIPRHPDFRLFACMNPATDVGKKSLPEAVRSRFTELYVSSPDSSRDALRSIVEKYIGELAQGDKRIIDDVAEAYVDIKRLAQRGELADGANQRPHFSIRTLARALTSAAQMTPAFGLRRSLFEGFSMCFVMSLDPDSGVKASQLLLQYIVANAKGKSKILSAVPSSPPGPHVQLGPFWLPTGPLAPEDGLDYILTPSVHVKLQSLARAISIGRFPILIQGPTSAGKTSSIEYLAKRTGHRFVRINNHEHTDLQEYLGSYVSDAESGALKFEEGLLVKALRRGDWIVLDELNLAPTDVLEALNRLLDDNRELFIPETGETVQPHPHFMLFATQNPPGLYGGRKVLSRAFRNRFLEAHFDDVPPHELETILAQRSQIAPSYASKIVAVFAELQRRRQQDRVFESKHGFATLRDLFRWGSRSAVGYEELAENGYMLLAERARRKEDRAAVQEVLENVLRVKIDVDRLYDLASAGNVVRRHLGDQFCDRLIENIRAAGLVPTRSLQRLVALQVVAFAYREPFLLVGEPGTGKTAVCDVVARAFTTSLDVLNCHQNTDASDLLGGQRPLRNRSSIEAHALDLASQALNQPCDSIDGALTAISVACKAASTQETDLLLAAQRALQRASALFEWYDGQLILSMKHGTHLLLDEISLADDSVLERLNSVFESARSITLPNRITEEGPTVAASEGFQVAATMNPGGDYGKKELSPALRNRFTEVWVPPITTSDDLIAIITDALSAVRNAEPLASAMLDFSSWLAAEVSISAFQLVNLRDYLAWATFVRNTHSSLTTVFAFVEGARLAIVEGLPTMTPLMAFSAERLSSLQEKASNHIEALARRLDSNYRGLDRFEFSLSDSSFSVGPYLLHREDSMSAPPFAFDAPTTLRNTLSVVRALQVPSKAILLEGSPGAGKTSLVAALAVVVGQQLVRINLSEQTEAADLFGSELPVEGGRAGEFSWRDAAFLTAMKEGRWVLLDEMNLASQSVLESLNSCLDHRGQVHVPELNITFHKHPGFRIFAAQNPQAQGGGRKGLPQSFLNRFTKVHVQELTSQDFLCVARGAIAEDSPVDPQKVVDFNRMVGEQVKLGAIGRAGGPWELNLRDVLRWLQASNDHADATLQPGDIIRLLYSARFRARSDRLMIERISAKVYPSEDVSPRIPSLKIAPSVFSMQGNQTRRSDSPCTSSQPALLFHQLPTVELLNQCTSFGWLGILTAESHTGKTSTIETLAKLCGHEVRSIRLSAASDASDLLGSFEHVDNGALLRERTRELARSCHAELRNSVGRRGGSSRDLCLLLDNLTLLHSNGLSADGHKALEAILLRMQSAALPTSIATAAKSVHELLANLDDSSDSSAKFTWVDGSLVRSVRQGDWVVLQDANQCPAAVLDRLNSLFEADPILVVAEKGSLEGEIESIKPHSNFRLFMTTDPASGELSRAMRNRGIEMSLLGVDNPTAAGSDDVRLGVSTRRRRPFLRQPDADSQREAQPATIASVAPFLEHSAQRTALLSLICATPTPSGQQVSSSDWHEASKVASAAHVLAFLGTGYSAAMSRLHCTRDLVSLINRLAAAADSDCKGHADAIPQPRDPLVFPDRNCHNVHVAERQRSLRLQLQDRAAIAVQHLSQIRAVASASPDSNSALSVSIFYRANCAESSWPIEVSQVDLLALLQDFAAAIFAGIQQEADNDLALRCDLHDIYYFIAGLASKAELDYAALQSILSLLAGSAAVKTLPASSPLSQACERILAHARVAALRGGVAIDLIWSSVARSQPKLLRMAFQTASLLLLPSFETDDFDSRWAKAIAFLQPLVLQWHKATTGDASELASIHAQLASASSSSKSAASDKHNLQRTDSPSFTLALFSIGSANQDGSASVTADSIAQQLHRHGALLASGADEKTLSRLLRGYLAVTSSTQARSALVDMAAWDLSWCRTLWSTETRLADLFRPLLLREAAGLMLDTKSSISDLDTNLQARDRHAHLLLLQSLIPQSRTQLLRAQLKTTVAEVTRMLLSGCGEAEELADNRHELARVLRDFSYPLQQPSPQTVRFPVDEFTRSTLGAWAALCDRFTKSKSVDSFGKDAIHSALLLLDLYLPEVPIDPIAGRQAFSRFTEVKAERVAAQEDVSEAFEEHTLRRSPSPFTSAWPSQTTFANGSTDRSSQEHGLPNRDVDLSRSTALHRELRAFALDVLDHAKVDALVAAMEVDQVTESTQARESLLQESLLAFGSSMEAKYSDLRDLIEPFLFVLSLLSLGFQALSAGSQRATHGASAEAAASLEQLLLGSTALSAMLLNSSSSPIAVFDSWHLDMCILHLSAAADPEMSGSPPDARSMDNIIGSLAEFARQRSEERARAEAEKSSIYKSKTHSIQVEDDANLDELDFRSLFPDFSDASDHGGWRDPSLADADLLNDADLAVVQSIFVGAYSSPRQASILGRLRAAFVTRWLSRDYVQLSDACDITGAHQFVSLLLSPPAKAQERPADFYKDSNYGEAARTSRITAALLSRLQQLISEWPEQEVLRHIAERCAGILRMHIASPVPRLMSAFEQLLSHTDDWETFASSQTSLRDHRAALTEAIVSWRRMELLSWSSLLDLRVWEQQCLASRQLLPLYQAAIASSQDAFKEGADALSRHLSGLIPLLDQFMRSAPVGEFEARLALLSALEQHCSRLHQDGAEGLAWQVPASSALRTTRLFFAQFQEDVRAHIAKHRGKFDKEISDFVKIATWKDTNVHALQQSAAKTHRKLHKVIAGFRKILQEGVDPLLANSHSPQAPLQQLSLSSSTASDGPVAESRAESKSIESELVRCSATENPQVHLQDLRRTLAILDRLRNAEIRDALQSVIVDLAVEFADDIRERTAELRAQTPAVQTKENEKAVKSLLAEKVRAFSDFLKEARRLGLPTSLKAHNTSRAFEQATLPPALDASLLPHLDSATAVGVEAHFVKMLALRPQLRAGLANRHPDVDLQGLVRAHASIEGLFSWVLDERGHVSAMSRDVARIKRISDRFSSIEVRSKEPGAPVFVLSARLQGQLAAFDAHCGMLASSAAQLRDELSQLQGPAALTDGSIADLRAELDSLCSTCQANSAALREKLGEVQVLDSLVVTNEDVRAFAAHLDGAVTCGAMWTQLLARWPFLQSFCMPILGRCRKMDEAIAQTRSGLAAPSGDTPSPTEASDNLASLISAIVLAAQRIKTISASISAHTEADKAFRADVKDQQLLRSALDAGRISQFVVDLIPQSEQDRNITVARSWRAALPFLRHYDSMAVGYIGEAVRRDAARLYLAHTAACIVLSLTTMGYCQPAEADDDAGAKDASSEDEQQQLEGGTGLGDGSGAKDISDQVKDDEDIEELQDQEAPGDDQGGETQAEASAKEVSDDFLGDLGAVDQGSEGGSDDEHDSLPDQDELDEAMDKVDDLDQQIDEQLWSGEQEAKPDTAPVDDRSGPQDSSNPESAAKENEPGNDQQEQDGPEESAAPEQAEENNPEEDTSMQEQAELGEQDEGISAEADNPERLGDDMDLAQDDQEESTASDDAGDDGEGHQTEAQPEAIDAQDGAAEAEQEQDTEAAMDAEETEQADNQSDAAEVESMPNGAREEEQAKGDHGEGADAGEARSKGGAAGGEQIEQATESGQDQNVDGPQQDEPLDLPRDEESEGTTQQVSGSAQLPAKAADASQSGERNQVPSGEAEMDSAQEEKPQQQHQGTLGDALREFRKDVQRIFDMDSADREAGADLERAGEEASEVEHVDESDDTHMQSIGATGSEQESNLKGVDIDHTLDQPAPLLEDQSMDAADLLSQQHDPSLLLDPSTDPGEAAPRGDAPSSGLSQAGAQRSDVDQADQSVQPADSDVLSNGAEELDLDLESRYAQFRDAEQPALDNAADIWQSYSARTADLSFQLCEQLRLVLSPTHATRMKGDYRTGKRLNMRQIIPFIASDFAKDKIWLRRTKPSARKYQVLLSIDDSKSMAQSRTAHLAMQTVALISGALSKLEVGDVAVCRFGRQMDILHGFGEQAFSRTDGARMVSAMTFGQRSTDVLALLRSSLEYLAQARTTQSSSGSEELWQLQIIVSDGMCEDHDRLRALLRQASENRVVVVFVVLDALNDPSASGDPAGQGSASAALQQQRSSILTMNRVSYEVVADGKMELKMERYLDTFPFDNFVIVRDVQSLPDVLSATLRQWAERVTAA